jgi:NitT/TauT family transport system permease protein
LITLAPFLIVALGLGIASKIAMTVLVSFFPLLMALVGAARSLPEDWSNYLTFRGATPTRKFWSVTLRLRLPDLFRALRIAASLSVVGAIVAEFNGASFGLGRNLFLAAKRLEPELMMVSLALAVCTSVSYYAVITLADARINRWYWSSVDAQ